MSKREVRHCFIFHGDFKTVGEMGVAVYKKTIGALGGGHIDDLRLKAPTNVANESSGPDGGYLLPDPVADTVMRRTFDDASLFNRTTQLFTEGNVLNVPTDLDVPWAGAGVTAHWLAERAQKPDSKPNIANTVIQLHKLAVFVPVTEELLVDAGSRLSQYLDAVAPERIRAMVDAAIINGTGVGQPLGFRNSPASLVVDKNAGQAAGTLVKSNLTALLRHLPGDSIGRAVFIAHASTLPALSEMPVGAFASLPGRQILWSEDASELGGEGDVSAVDLSQYICVIKTVGIERAVSIHMYFDQGLSCFRFILRIGGRPWLGAPYTRKNGSDQVSPFAVLGARE